MKLAMVRLWMRVLRRVGPSGIAGLAVLALGILLLAWLPRLRVTRADALQSVVVNALASKQAPRSRPAALSPADATRNFVAGFPAIAQNASDLTAVFGSADLHHVALLKGEYQLKVEPDATFMAYTATFPVHGSYEALKDFSADVLTSLPHVALDELRISRENAGTSTLDAVVRFTFFYRSR